MALTVRAERLGYYGEKRRRIGTEFVLSSTKDFSHEWMHPIDFTPETAPSRAPRRNQQDSASLAKEDVKSKMTGSSTGDQQVI